MPMSATYEALISLARKHWATGVPRRSQASSDGASSPAVNARETHSDGTGSKKGSNRISDDSQRGDGADIDERPESACRAWLDRAALSVRQKFVRIMKEHAVDEHEIMLSWLETSTQHQTGFGKSDGQKAASSISMDSSFISMHELDSLPIFANYSHNTRPRKLLLCRIVPFSALRNSKHSSSLVSSSSSNARQRMSLIAKDDTGELPCIVTDSSTKLLGGIYFFSRWKMVRAMQPTAKVTSTDYGCKEGRFLFRYLEIDTRDKNCVQILSLPLLLNHAAGSSKNYRSSSLRRGAKSLTNRSWIDVSSSAIADAIDVSMIESNLSEYENNQGTLLKKKRKKTTKIRGKATFIIRGRVVAVSPLIQQPKDRSKSFCFLDIASDFSKNDTSEQSTLTQVDQVAVHVYLRGIDAEFWHPFLRVGSEYVITNLCPKTLEARLDGKAKQSKYSVLFPSRSKAKRAYTRFQSKKRRKAEEGTSRECIEGESQALPELSTLIITCPTSRRSFLPSSSSSSSSSSSLSSSTSPFSSMEIVRSEDGVSYTGFITRRVDEFTFELDNEERTRLFLFNHIASNLGAGLRPGSKVCLHNVHMVYLHGVLAGFGACMYSQIQLLSLAPGFSSILVSRSLSTSHLLLSRIVEDLKKFHLSAFQLSAWLSETVNALTEKFGSQLGSRYLHGFASSRDRNKSILSKIVHGLSLSDDCMDEMKGEQKDFFSTPFQSLQECVSSEQRDMHSEFFLHRHGCICHTSCCEPHKDRKRLPRIVGMHVLQKGVLKIAESKSNQYSETLLVDIKRGSRKSPEAEWETLELQPGDVSVAIFNEGGELDSEDSIHDGCEMCLVGWLEGCPFTGRLMLTDATGSIDCVCEDISMIHLKQSRSKYVSTESTTSRSSENRRAPMWMFEKFTICVERCLLTGSLRPYIHIKMSHAISLTSVIISQTEGAETLGHETSTKAYATDNDKKSSLTTVKFIATEISNPMARTIQDRQLGQVKVVIRGYLVGNEEKSSYPIVCLVGVAKWTNVSEIEQYYERKRLDALLMSNSSIEENGPSNYVQVGEDSVRSEPRSSSSEEDYSRCLLPSALPCVQIGSLYRVDGLSQQNDKTFLMDRSTNFTELPSHRLSKSGNFAAADHSIDKVLSSSVIVKRPFEIAALKCLIIGLEVRASRSTGSPSSGHFPSQKAFQKLLGVGVSSAKLFLSLRDLEGPQRIDAYLDVQSLILPLGLRPGAVIQLSRVKSSLTNREDRVFLVETFSERTVSGQNLPSILSTSLRVLTQAEFDTVAYPEERLPKHTLCLLRRISQSSIWSLFLIDAFKSSNNDIAKISKNVPRIKFQHKRPGLNAIMRLDVCIVRVVYLKIATIKSTSMETQNDSCGLPCNWQMSCIVDDGTGQAMLHLRGRNLVRRTLMMDNTEACMIENLALSSDSANKGVLEYSSARKMQHTQHIYGYGLGQNQMVWDTPSMVLSRRVDLNGLLRPVTVYCRLSQGISSGQRLFEGREQHNGSKPKRLISSIDMGNQTTVQTFTLRKIHLDAIDVEESTAESITRETWRLLTTMNQ